MSFQYVLEHKHPITREEAIMSLALGYDVVIIYKNTNVKHGYEFIADKVSSEEALEAAERELIAEYGGLL